MYVRTTPTTVPTVRARTILLSSTYYVLLHCWCTYVHTLKKKALLQSRRTTCTYWWCTYVYWRKKSASCLKDAPTAHDAVPADVRTYPPYKLLTIAISTHLLYKTAVPTIRTYCCTHSWWMYSYAAVRNSCTHWKQQVPTLLTTYVR